MSYENKEHDDIEQSAQSIYQTGRTAQRLSPSGRQPYSETPTANTGTENKSLLKKVRENRKKAKHGKIKGKKKKGSDSKLVKKLKIYGIAGLMGLLMIAALVGNTSQSQMDDTFKLNAEGGSTIEPADKEASLKDQDAAKEQTGKLLAIIETQKASDKERQIENIKKEVKQMGYDVDLSMGLLSEESALTAAETFIPINSNLKVQNFDLSGYNNDARSTYPVVKQSELYFTSFNPFKNTSYHDDNIGICRFDSIGDPDYLVAMPSMFGEVGNRYIITFTDGSNITVLKCANYESSTAVFRTVINYNVYSQTQKQNCEDLPFYGKTIQSIDLAESQFANKNTQSFTIQNNRVLAAFSVALDNGQIVQNPDGSYSNQIGGPLKTYTYFWGSNRGLINYEKSLEEGLKAFKNAGGHFYDVDYERQDGQIKVYLYVEVWYETYEVDVIGEDGMPTGETKEVTVKKTKNHYYVHPILKEKNVDEMAEDIFGLDTNAIYVNSKQKNADGTMGEITVREAISHIAEGTQAVLFGVDVSSDVFYFTGFDGRYEWPAPGNFRITSMFGGRIHPITHVYKQHTGVDIAGVTGAPTVAADEGTVILARTNGGYGNCVMIKHPDGNTTLYGHLSAIAVSEGQSVSKGQQIGLIGSTGNSTGPHLHFEVIVNGTKVEPLAWITTTENYSQLIF